MHKLVRLFSLEWSTILQYRSDMILWTLGEAAVPLIALAVWYAVSQSAAHFAFSPAETIVYYVLIVLVRILTNAWNGFFFSRQILNGELVQFLLRPLSVFWHHVSNNITEKLLKLPIPFIIIGIFFWLAPSLRPLLASYVPRLPLFVASVVLAAAIAFVLDMILGSLAFWLEDATQLRRYKELIYEVSSGILIPLAALPPLALAIFSFLPFRYVISVPIEIVMGTLPTGDIAVAMFYQVMWLIGLLGLQIVVWHRGLKRYAVPTQ